MGISKMLRNKLFTIKIHSFASTLTRGKGKSLIYLLKAAFRELEFYREELLKQNPLGRPLNHRPPSVRPSQRHEPPSPAVFKFFWMKPKEDPKTTTEATTERRKKKRKKISDRPGLTKDGRKKKRRRKKNRRKKNKRRRKPLREPFVPEFEAELLPKLPEPVPAVPNLPDPVPAVPFLPEPVPAVPVERPKKFAPVTPPPEKTKDATNPYG